MYVACMYEEFPKAPNLLFFSKIQKIFFFSLAMLSFVPRIPMWAVPTFVIIAKFGKRTLFEDVNIKFTKGKRLWTAI